MAKQFYYVDYTAMLEEDFYREVEHLLATVPEITFLVDSNVYDRINDFRELSSINEALTLENYVNLFTVLGNTLQLSTNNGFDPEALRPMAQEQLTVITQQGVYRFYHIFFNCHSPPSAIPRKYAVSKIQNVFL